MTQYNTLIPLVSSTTYIDIIELFKKWIEGSPHYKTRITYNPNSRFDYEAYDSESKESVDIIYYDDPTVNIVACRFQKQEESIIWITDFIFFEQFGSKSALIQLSCDSKILTPRLPKIHKPHIVKMLIQSGLCKADRMFPISDTPIFINDDNIEQCIEYMAGQSSDSLPMLYVSKDFDEYKLNYIQISKWLSGLAHVVVEINKSYSFELKGRVSCRNAHNGFIGVYYPGSSKMELFNPSDYLNQNELQKAISLSIQQAMVNSQFLSPYNWNHVMTLRAKHNISLWKEQSLQKTDELDQYILSFDHEISELKEKNALLNAQNDSLIAEKDTYKAQLQDIKEDTLLSAGKLEEYYIGEKNDLLYNLLSLCIDKLEQGTRPYELLASIIDSNNSMGIGNKMFSELKNIFRGDGKLTSASKSRLEKIGFTIKDENVHYKLEFHDPKYVFIVSKSPSDHREGKNVYSDITKKIDIYRKMI